VFIVVATARSVLKFYQKLGRIITLQCEVTSYRTFFVEAYKLAIFKSSSARKIQKHLQLA
jgi:hypothetical protein